MDWHNIFNFFFFEKTENKESDQKKKKESKNKDLEVQNYKIKATKSNSSIVSGIQKPHLRSRPLLG